MVERSEIQFGLTPIPFTIRRSDKRTTVALTIDGGKLVVTAPVAASVDQLKAVVRRKGFWVVERIKRASEAPPPPTDREFVTGETVLHRGRQFRLKVVESDDIYGDRIWAGWYEVPVPATLTGAARRNEVRRRLLGSLKERADIYLPMRLTELCKELGVEKPSIIVREQKKRWGSCDAGGTLRINWRIVQAPPPLIDYVLAHELVHRTHLRHGPEFWAELGRLMPDYEQRRARLRAMGRVLEW